jgi:hypothetical protein
MHQVFDTKCFNSMISGERNWEVLSKLCSDQSSKDFFSQVFAALHSDNVEGSGLNSLRGVVELSPTLRSQVLSKLCCQKPNHNKLPLFVVCEGEAQPYCLAPLFACQMPQSFLTFPS